MSLEENPALSQAPESTRAGSRRGLARVASISVGAASAVVAGFIFLGYRQLDSLRRQIEARQSQLNDLQSRYDALDTSYRELETSYNQLKYIASALKPQAEPGNGSTPGATSVDRPASGITASPVNRTALSNGPATSTAQVVIHIVDESQRREAEALAAQLRAAGYIVPVSRGIVLVGSFAPRLTQLRYFQRSDEQGPYLAGIAKVLQQAKVEAHLMYIPPDTRSAATPGKFELWLGAAE